MTGAVTIRRFTAADLPAIMDIEYASYSTPWSEATFRGLLRRTDADLLAAVVDGCVVGYAISWYAADQAELGNVAVAGVWRRRGIAARLLDAVLECARSRGIAELFLEVRPSNTGAQRLYLRYGFTEVARRRNYYLAPREDAIVMRRPIAAEPSPTP